MCATRAQLDMFQDFIPARSKPRVLMHVSDATQVDRGHSPDLGKPMCRTLCRRCARETEWLIFDSLTEAKRGIPCPDCIPGIAGG